MGVSQRMREIQNLTRFNMPNLVERGLASNPKMEYQVFLCIFQKNSAMAILGLKEMGKFLWEGREKSSFGKCKEKPGIPFWG